ncbi:MAG TPA: LysR family transcriptional regulator [Dongiaceae bacterium]|jgi:DNA-binding transcriptional LysR family regulator|nr:LysR family transcriptional regulator [Dongiaceae bacterium]
MRNPGFAEMNAFVAVAEQRSFAKAATRLGVSRSRLSETISGLEARLGVRLLNRTTRSVSLTIAGERLLARLRPLLDEFAATLDSVNEFRDKPSGLLRLTVPPPAASFVLAPIIARFLAEYPAISLDISVDSALTDIVAARFDAGIRPGERIARDMIALRIGWETTNVAVAAPSYLAHHPRPETPRDLEAHDCIRFRFPSGVTVPWLFERKGKRIEVAVEGRLIINDPELGIRAAVDGAGLLYTPLDYVAAHIAARRLVPLLEEWQFRLPGLFLYYPSRRQIPTPLQAFIAFMRRNSRSR